MVLCWVDTDQKADRVQDFSDLGKCSRQQGLYQSTIGTELIHAVALALSQAQKILKKSGLRSRLAQQGIFLGLP